MYLGGYAVECMLKSLIVESTPPKKQEDLAFLFRGPHAHSFEWLRQRYLEAGAPQLPKEIARSLILVGGWSVALRYEPGVQSIQVVERFLSGVNAICHWADGRT
jgi:hypothetical protein